jgi:hypothetical protein
MPAGKPAGVRCAQLSADDRCLVFDHPERPAVCRQLRPSPEMCGTRAQDAFIYLRRLERDTTPDR